MIDIPLDAIENPATEYVQVVEKKNPFLIKDRIKTKGIIKPPSKNAKPKTYEQLVRSKKDEEVITELITSMGQKTKVNLLLNSLHMEELGDKVRHVHPYKFFGYIFSHEDLKESMQMVLDDFWKRSMFINGMVPSLNNEHRVGSLKKYLKDFCKETGTEPYQIQPFINSRDWTGMLYFLASQ